MHLEVPAHCCFGGLSLKTGGTLTGKAGVERVTTLRRETGKEDEKVTRWGIALNGGRTIDNTVPTHPIIPQAPDLIGWFCQNDS